MSRKSLLAVLALLTGVAIVFACTRQERTTTVGTTTTTGADTGVVLETPVSDGAPASGVVPSSGQESPESTSVDTTGPVAGTLAELRDRLAAEARSLDRAVKAADFDEVTSRALRVRDLIVALDGKATTLPAAKAQEIDALVSPATNATEKMRTHAATRQIAGVQAQNTELQGVVAKILAASAGR